jgi:hypothetical protein
MPTSDSVCVCACVSVCVCVCVCARARACGSAGALERLLPSLPTSETLSLSLSFSLSLSLCAREGLQGALERLLRVELS